MGLFQFAQGLLTARVIVAGALVELLQNEWVVGIGGGIISGFVVYALTALIFSKQSKRDLHRRTANANQEVVLAVRQGVPEGKVPEGAVLTALIEATARKHGLQSSDMYGASEVAQDLIKDVMDSSFISAETKEAYASQLSELIKPQMSGVETGAKKASSSMSTAQMAFVSVAFATMAASTTLFAVLSESRSGSQSPLEALTAGVWVPIAALLVSTLTAAVLAYAMRMSRKSEQAALRSRMMLRLKPELRRVWKADVDQK